MSLRLGACVIAAMVVSLAGSASADWPTARHDPARTGAADGKSNIATPDVFWRYYLGGRVNADALRAVDVAKEGKAAIVYATAGRVTAKRPDDSVIWQSAKLEIDSLIDIQDLNGDGTLDVVARSSDRVFVLEGTTGNVEWSEAQGEMGTIGGVRVGDFDGDLLPDMLVMECGCCGVSSGKTGFLYSFKAGFAAPAPVWTLPSIACASFLSSTAFQPHGDGVNDVILSSPTSLAVIDGRTGTSRASVASDYPATYNECMPADVDGVHGEEVLCVGRQTFAGRWHRLFAMKFDDAATPATLSILWDIDVGETNGSVDLVPGGALDLDGDGKPEIVVSGLSIAGVYTTHVVDGASGMDLGSVVGQRVTGAARLEKTRWTVLTSGADDSLGSFKFNRGTGLTPLWSLGGATVVTAPGPDSSRTTTLGGRTVATDLTGDGVDDLLVFRGLPAGRVDAYLESGSIVSLIGSYELPKTSSASQAWVVPPASGSAIGALAIARNDGLVQVFDKKLAPTTVGLTVGGYYSNGVGGNLESTPVVAPLGATAQSILVTDSRRSLLRLDPLIASNTAPPLPRWTRPDASAATVVAKLDGAAAGIVCQALQEPLSEPPVHQVIALTAGGTALWTSPLEGVPFHDPLAADMNGDGVPDVATQWGSPTDTLLHTLALDGKTGTLLWNSAPVDPGAGRQPRGFALKDWNGDGSADVVFQAAATRVLSGQTGLELAAGPPSEAYALPTLFDVNGDGLDEVTLHAGSTPARTLTHDLSTALWTGPANTPYPAGAIAICAAGGIFVEGSGQNTATLRLTVMAGPSAGAATVLALAGGAKYATEADARAAGAVVGQLSNTSIHANLDGSGKPIALLGSTDGFLYAVDPCSGDLKFARDFRSPVGEAVFGDTDGDGNDEILVTVADGFLYDLRARTLPAPQNVADLDPDHGATTVDVDVTQSSTSLTAKWDPVDGADSYEVAAVGPDGTYVTTPEWTNVGKVTQGRIDKLVLVPDGRYLFGVRAKSIAKGTGPDGTSNGVTYRSAGDAGAADAEVGSDASTDADAPLADSNGPSETGADSSGDAAGTQADSSGCGCRLVVDPVGSRTGGVGALFGAGALLAVRRRRQALRAAGTAGKEG